MHAASLLSVCIACLAYQVIILNGLGIKWSNIDVSLAAHFITVTFLANCVLVFLFHINFFFHHKLMNYTCNLYALFPLLIANIFWLVDVTSETNWFFGDHLL